MTWKPLKITKLKEKSYLSQKKKEFPKFDSKKYVPLRINYFSKLWSGTKIKLAYFDFIENKWKNFTFQYEVIEKKNLKEKLVVGKSTASILKYVMRDHNNHLFLHVYDNSNLVYWSLNPRFSPLFRRIPDYDYLDYQNKK